MGGQLRVRLENDRCVIHTATYYTPPIENKHIKSLQESTTELHKYLGETLQRLQPAKNEVTILLSGGIDSSIISTLYKKTFNLNTSYSTAYPFESGVNLEKRYALSAAKALQMNHCYYEPTTEKFLTGILEAISYAEEPLHHLQSVLLHLLWKNKIPREKRIILCAQGAGSTFGHNQIFYFYQKRKQLLYRLAINNLSLSLLKKLSNITATYKPFIEIIDKLHHDFPVTHPENPIWTWMDYGSWEWAQTYFKTTKNQIIKERNEIIKEFSDLSLYDIWSRYSLYGDEDVTLAIWSKIGEKNNKIIYYPFYDTKVLNSAFSIPWRLKIQKQRLLTKELARQRELPKFIINRPKLAFGITSQQWAKQGDVFEPLMPVVSKIFDEREIRKLQSTNNRRTSQTFWNIVNYSIWKRLCINNESLDLLLEELNSVL
jgi:asparagine synthase (glutamine-hydrolysing)